MKTKKLLLAIITLTVTMTVNAQENVLKAFEKIEKSTSIHPSYSKNEERDSTGRIISSTYYMGFKMGNLKDGLPNLLQEAFEKDKDKAKMAFINTSPDAPRHRYQIIQRGGRNISLGEKKGSSYFILTFPDNEHPGYRHAYAAEWWNADDPDNPNIKEGYTVIAYGETPSPLYGASSSLNMNGPWGMDSTVFRILPNSDWAEQIERIQDIPLPDLSQMGMFNGQPMYWDGQSQQWRNVPYNEKPHNLPDTGNKDEWLANAMDHVENLSNSDWHRLFGIITQKMIEGNNSNDDLIVAAGIVLQLCKHADQLDEDENRVCESRLRTIAKKFTDPYIRDMLNLSAKKLEELR